jgi:glycerophosphoryl diester phosphodiesterase
MEIYAHRTARGLAAENTLAGCAICIELGVDYIDLDIGMTKDGVLVVTHDIALNPDLTRDEKGGYIKKRIPIRSLTFAQLQKYNVGKVNPHSKYATYFPDQTGFDEAKIPSLKEVIAYVKKNATRPIGFQIEIKTHHRHTPPPKVFAQAVDTIIQETKVFDRSEVQSFDFRCLHELRKLNPLIKTSFVSNGRVSPKTVYSLGGSCWSLYEMDATPAKIKKAQKMGLKVLTWNYPEKEGTEFNKEQISKLIAWGVDGIITDRPDKLKDLLHFR